MVFDAIVKVYNREKTSDGMGGSKHIKGPERLVECKIVSAMFQKVVSGNKIEKKNEIKIMTNASLDEGAFVFINREYKIKNGKSVKGIQVYDLEEVI